MRSTGAITARLAAAALAIGAVAVGGNASSFDDVVSAQAPGLVEGIANSASGSPEPARRLAPLPKRVLMVGDSTLAAVRNVTASQDLFFGFDPVLDAQGCRRLVWPSCFSDSDFRTPNTVEQAILTTPGTLDVVVVMSGYNDWHDPFGQFVDAIMAASRSKGAEKVVFLTLSVGTWPETSATAIEVFAENTQMLWESKQRHPDLIVADWRNYNQHSFDWMAEDGVHLEALGAFGLADYISRWIAYIDGRACTAPMHRNAIPQDPCPSPNSMTSLPDVADLYGR